jgi:hypothetical protein
MKNKSREKCSENNCIFQSKDPIKGVIHCTNRENVGAAAQTIPPADQIPF